MSYWWFAAGAFDKYLAMENGHEIVPGIYLHFASRQIAGFPFRVDAILDDLEIDVATKYGPLTWRSERFAMHMLTYARSRQLFEAAGKQFVSWTDVGGEHHHFGFVPGSLQASAIESNSGLSRFDLDIVGIGSAELSGTRAQFHIRREPDHDALDISVSGDNLILAPDLRAVFGEEIKRLSVEGKATPATPLTPLLAGQDEWRSVAEMWRRRAGTLTLRHIDLTSVKRSETGTGQLSLDSDHRLRGTLELRSKGQESLSPWKGEFVSTAGPLY